MHTTVVHERRQRILDALNQNGGCMNSKSLAEITEINKRTLSTYLATMVKRGKLRRRLSKADCRVIEYVVVKQT